MARQNFDKRWEICYKLNQEGFVALVSVLILSLAGISVALYLLLSGISFTKSGNDLEQSAQARALSNACAEEALLQIRQDIAFVGSSSLQLGAGSCDYSVQNTGGENRLIDSSSYVGAIISKVRVDIDQINPVINIISWQEVADF